MMNSKKGNTIMESGTDDPQDLLHTNKYTKLSSSRWFGRMTFGGISLGFVAAGFICGIFGLWQSNGTAIQASFIVSGLAFIFGVITVINAHGKHWGKNKNHELHEISRTNYFMGRMGILLSVASPICIIGVFTLILLIKLSSL